MGSIGTSRSRSYDQWPVVDRTAGAAIVGARHGRRRPLGLNRAEGVDMKKFRPARHLRPPRGLARDRRDAPDTARQVGRATRSARGRAEAGRRLPADGPGLRGRPQLPPPRPRGGRCHGCRLRRDEDVPRRAAAGQDVSLRLRPARGRDVRLVHGSSLRTTYRRVEGGRLGSRGVSLFRRIIVCSARWPGRWPCRGPGQVRGRTETRDSDELTVAIYDGSS